MKHKRLKPLTYAQTVRFHGHNGPFLALGYRLGEHVNTMIKPKGIMAYHITVYVRKEKPFTCVIDGLQCATFATMGKGNIQVKKRKEPSIRVKIVTARRGLTFTSTTRALALCRGQKDLELAASAVFKERFSSLWKQGARVDKQKAR